MRRHARGPWPLALLAALVLWLIALPLWAGPLQVSGRVLGPDGQGLAGAIVSDGTGVTKSDASGAFALASQGGRVVGVTAPVGYSTSGRWWWPAEQAQQVEAYLVAAAHAGLEPQVALISDPHLMNAQFPTVNYPPPPGGWDLPMKVWDRVAGQVKSAKPVLTVVAGDLCMDADQGQPDHAEGQMKLSAQALALLPSPARALPGNHDVRYGDGQAGPTVDYGLWHQHLGPSRHLYLLKGMAWVFLDNTGRGQGTTGKPRSLGRTPPEGVAWLKAVLEALPKDLPLALVTHYPLASPVAGVNPLHGGALVKAGGEAGAALRDTDQAAPEILALLKGRPVLAFISGHEHAFHQTLLPTRSGLWQFTGLPALCGKWWLGDRDWGPLAFPAGYVLMALKSTPAGPRLESRFVEVRF
ncbi:MAG: metallophosphoesterase [Desulfarculus sp.]|nr:metallophosphoesterase [Desulfarculus sp.]